MARSPNTSTRWTPPPERIAGERLLKAREVREGVSATTFEAQSEVERLKEELARTTSVNQATRALSTKVEKLEQNISKLIADLALAMPMGGGGGRRTVAKHLRRDFILDDDDMTVGGSKIPLRNNVADWVNAKIIDNDNLAVSGDKLPLRNNIQAWTGGIGVDTVGASDQHKNIKVKLDRSGYRLSRSPFYDPYDYGATGNGVTDDTSFLVLTQTGANANEGIQAGPKGRGVIVLPPGKFKTTGLITQNSNEFWMGLGGTLDAMAANQTVFACSHGRCTVENMIITQTFRPTTIAGTVRHDSLTPQGAPDCMFRKLLIVGGYYGIDCDGATLFGAGDSIWLDCKVVGCYSDFVYLHGYNGFWGIRNKFDGDWPTAVAGYLHPLTANIRGAWATSTNYFLHDIVTANGYYFQCSTPGTSAGSGSGPVSTLKGTAIVDGAAQWKTHRTSSASAFHVDSDCFINILWMTDMTGGHINASWLTNLTGVNRPQTVKYLDGCEFGIPLFFGLRADDADDVEVGSMVIDNCIETTVGAGVITNNVRGIDIHNNMIRQNLRGVSIGAATTGASVDHNTFGGISGWCVEFQAGVVGFSAVGNKCGGSPWGANANGIRVLAGASDEYIVALNRGTGISGLRWSDLGTGTNKHWAGNI